MNVEELQAALREATPELQPRPTLTADVMRGGVRRLRIRRLTVAAATVAAAALVTTTASFGWQILSEPNQVATNPQMTKPTRGDLAGDQAFIAEVLDVWDDKTQKVSAKVVTKPHVYWAGTTPAGRAAVVLQETETKEIVRSLVGVHAKTQELRTLIIEEPGANQEREVGYKFGPEDRFVLVLSQDRPLLVSDKVSYDNAAGLAKREWRLMRESDGVALAELPVGSGPMDASVIAGNADDGITDDEHVDLYHADESVVTTIKVPGSTLGWGNNPAAGPHLMKAGQSPAHGNEPAWLYEHWNKGLQGTDLFDPANPEVAGPPEWFVTTTGNEASTVIISEYAPIHSGPSRLYAVTVTADGRIGKTYSVGPIQPQSPLPVLVKLPDESGKVAAAKGAKLSYRTTKDGAWLEDATDALRVPNDAVEIRVTLPGKEPAIVPANR